MWTYRQRTGEVFHDGTYIATGYSGADPDPKTKGEPGEGKNKPEAQTLRGVGPVPVGSYRIGKPFLHPSAGAVVMRLHPLAGTNTHGRSGFLIHGDSKSKPGTASHGCIVLSFAVRHLIADQVLCGDDRLEVVSGDEPKAAA